MVMCDRGLDRRGHSNRTRYGVGCSSGSQDGRGSEAKLGLRDVYANDLSFHPVVTRVLADTLSTLRNIPSRHCTTLTYGVVVSTVATLKANVGHVFRLDTNIVLLPPLLARRSRHLRNVSGHSSMIPGLRPERKSSGPV